MLITYSGRDGIRRTFQVPRQAVERIVSELKASGMRVWAITNV